MKKIAVIGGGITGLVSALELSKDFKVTVFEKEDYLGGLLNQIEIGGEKVDAFYHHFFKGDTELINLYRKLGLREEIIFHPSSVGILKDGKISPLNHPLDFLLLPFISLGGKLRLGLGVVLFSKTGWRRFKNKTAKDVGQKWMGKEGWGKFWYPLFYSKFGEQANKISGAWFWGRVAGRLPSREFGREVLGYPKSGFGLLTDTLVKEIKKNGGEIITGKEVTEEPKDYDAVLDTRTRGECLGVVCVILKTTKPLPYYWINAFDEAPFMAAISQAKLDQSSKNVIYLPMYTPVDSGIYNALDQEIKKDFIKSFCELFHFSEEEILEAVLAKAPKAQPIIMPGYKVPPVNPKLNHYHISMAHIYPFDRGLNHAVKLADEVTYLIREDLGIK